MLKQSAVSQTGFTLLEAMLVIAIIAILAAVAVAGYQQYTMRARGTEIVTQYDALHTGARARVQTPASDDCAVLATSYGTSNLASPYATLGYGFEAVAGGGYRPVLSVCARADSNGPLNLKVARGVYDTLSKDGVVEANPVLSDTVVSFALRLTDEGKALCRTWASQTTTPCSSAPSATAPQTAPAQAVSHAPLTGPLSIPVPSTSPVARAAETSLATTIATAASTDEALAQTIAAAQGLPPEALTQSVPANTPEAKAFLARCPIPSIGRGPCKDNYQGDCNADFGGHFDDCIAGGMICPKSAGLCQGVTPEMRRLLDLSMQRIQDEWMAQHPRCTRFQQTGC